MTETGLPAESQQQFSGPPPGASSGGGGILDGIMWMVIAMLAAGLIALAGWWGYSAWRANTNQQLSTPAARSIEALKANVAKSPSDAAARVRLAEALGTAGMSDEALNQLQQAIKIDAKHTGAWLDTGMVLIDKKDYTQAAAALQKVVTLTEGTEMQDSNQRREQAMFYLAKIAMQEKRYDDAVKWAKGALRIKRDASDSYLVLAQAYRAQGNTDRALLNLRIALTFDPNFALAAYERGQLLKGSKDLAQVSIAARDLRHAVELVPDAKPPADALKSMGTSAAWLAKATAAQSAGKSLDARYMAEVALALEPGNIKAGLLYGQLLEKLGGKANAKAALQTYKQVLELDAKNAAATEAVKRLSGGK